MSGEGAFSRGSGSDAAELVDLYPLAWVVSAFPDFQATPLPLLADTDSEGRITSLTGHFALSNPHVDLLRASPRALFLFNGPQAYVSPGLLSRRDWAPTWNYAVLRIVADIGFDEALNDVALERLVARMERDSADPWRIGSLGSRYETMRAHVIAFSARVVSLRARFKLGQDEKPEDFREITSGHPDLVLAEWMRRARFEDS